MLNHHHSVFYVLKSPEHVAGRSYVFFFNKQVENLKLFEGSLAQITACIESTLKDTLQVCLQA